MGKSTINVPFSIAMLNYQRVETPKTTILRSSQGDELTPWRAFRHSRCQRCVRTQRGSGASAARNLRSSSQEKVLGMAKTWVNNGWFLWISIDFYGILWISIDFYWFEWTSTPQETCPPGTFQLLLGWLRSIQRHVAPRLRSSNVCCNNGTMDSLPSGELT